MVRMYFGYIWCLTLWWRITLSISSFTGMSMSLVVVERRWNQIWILLLRAWMEKYLKLTDGKESETEKIDEVLVSRMFCRHWKLLLGRMSMAIWKYFVIYTVIKAYAVVFRNLQCIVYKWLVMYISWHDIS